MQLIDSEEAVITSPEMWVEVMMDAVREERRRREEKDPRRQWDDDTGYIEELLRWAVYGDTLLVRDDLPQKRKCRIYYAARLELSLTARSVVCEMPPGAMGRLSWLRVRL